MDGFGSFISSAWDAFNLELNIFGFSFSFKVVLIFLFLASLVIGFIARLFNS